MMTDRESYSELDEYDEYNEAFRRWEKRRCGHCLGNKMVFLPYELCTLHHQRDCERCYWKGYGTYTPEKVCPACKGTGVKAKYQADYLAEEVAKNAAFIQWAQAWKKESDM